MTGPPEEAPQRWGAPLDAPYDDTNDSTDDGQPRAGAKPARRSQPKNSGKPGAGVSGSRGTAKPPAAPSGPSGPRRPEYANVADWVAGFLLPHYRRRLLNTRWCRQWWAHTEAISRLEAIWQAWEALRLDGATGIAVWWRDYADPHLRILTDREGPFYDCDATRDHHTETPPMPSDDPPAGMFRDRDHPEEQPRP